jgi:hypothetical protein
MNALDPVWETINRQFEAVRFESAQAARSQVLHELNQLLRRLRQHQSESQWASAILDGTSQFAHQVALFTCHDDVLNLRGHRNLNLAENLSFSPLGAAAFESAIKAKDMVVAVRTPSEVGEALSSSGSQEHAYVIPIIDGARVIALLFGAQDHLDLNGVELVAGLASTVLERHSNISLRTQVATQSPAANTPPRSASAPFPYWADLSADQRMLHVRAHRFARVKVAEMQLSRPDACHAGRQQSNLYVFLRHEIDKARETYRGQFMTIPSMVDYLHLELVRTAAENDEQKLGADYPGQLV